ncbi:pentapeptide repeat-containing protein [Streptomyces sp. NPDC050433]|uniref:pentapeptide repeat-containing protein n=1 Tax=Streptomyces sp. NPDC050433 TaxID=3365615 RepID=UPI0037A4F56E
MEVRLGGIYALERIMQDSHRDHPTIANVLATYLRSHAATPPTKGQDVSADVHAAFTVLATRNTTHDDDSRLDLRSVRLPGVEPITPDSARTDLSGAALSRANLSSADLSDANLTDTDLTDTDLTGTDLRGANLSRANLRETNLRDALLHGADLSGAVNLTKNQLNSARIDGKTRLPARLS